MTVSGLFSIMSETETGFLANGIVNILEISKTLNKNELYLLKKGSNFIKDSINGKRQIEESMLEQNAIKTMGSYYLALTVINKDNKYDNKTIFESLNIISKELEDTISAQKINPENVIEAKNFFNKLQKFVIDEIGNKFYNNYEVEEW